MIDDKAIGRIIKELRLAGGITQEDLAEKLGFSVNYISLVENGHRGVPFDRLDDFADVLDVPSSFIPFMAEASAPGIDAAKLMAGIKKLMKAAIDARTAATRLAAD